MGFFERAVILVVENSSRRSVGLLLNRPSGVQIQDLAIEDSIASVFGRSSLRLGGPHLPSNLHLLHGNKRVDDNFMLCPGLYTGGLQSAMQLVSQGQCHSTDFALLAGYTGWRPGQLEAEIRDQAWICLSADPQMVLDIACRDDACSSAWHRLFSLVSEADRTYIER
jgi:putative transcriptional regulator